MKVISILILLMSFSLTALAQDPINDPLPKRALAIPLVHQTTDYTCGPASVLAVLKFFNRGATEKEMELANEMSTSTETGTRFWDIKKAFATRGFKVKATLNNTLRNLKTALAKRKGIIINFLSGGEGHYTVLSGIIGKKVYMMDPWNDAQYSVMDLDEFLNNWYDFHSGIRYDGLMISVSP